MKFGKSSDAYIGLCKQAAKLAHLGIGVARQTIRFALHLIGRGRAIAAFRDHIIMIVFGCAKKQMSGIHTAWIVAFVQAIKVVGKRAVGQSIREAMRPAHVLPVPKLAVAMIVGSGKPRPTIIRPALVHFCPKARRRCSSLFPFVGVTHPVANRLTLDVTKPRIATEGDWGWLSTAAHAKAGGIQWPRRFGQAPIMTIQVAQGFTLDPSPCNTVNLGYLGLLSTTTVAITVRNFLGGIVRGMIVHSNSLLSAVAQSQGHSRGAAWCFVLGPTPVSIPQTGV